MRKNLAIKNIFCITALATLIISCPSPLNEEKLLLVTDVIPPVISITAPLHNSYYSSLVEVTGTVNDSLEGGDEAGEVTQLSWSLEPAFLPGGNIEITNKQFSFSFLTAGFTGTVVLRIDAVDQNNNMAFNTVTLQKSSSSIPSFTAIPDNGQVTLTWDDVPGAASYNLYYTTDGSVPGPQFGTTVTSVTAPFTLSDLENGSKHVFLLEAVGGTFNDTSDYIEVVPLGEFTLAPEVKQLESSMWVSWSPIPGTDTFEVWRSESAAGPYILINGSCLGNSYIDTHIAPSTRYYYKIALVSGNPLLSEFGSCNTNMFLNRGFKSNYMMTYGPKVIIPYGDALYVENTSGQVITFDISNPNDLRAINYSRFTSVTGSTAGSGDISLSGELMLFAGHSNGFHSLDLTNPLVPVELDMLPGESEIPVNYMTYHVALDGFYAYVSISQSNEYRIEQIDFSDPSSLSVGGTRSISSFCWDLETSGGYLYAMVQDAGIQIFDLSEFPDAPPVDTIPLPESKTLSRKIRIIGTQLYAFYDDTGIQITDLSNPGSPGSVTIVPPPEGNSIKDFIIVDNYGYAACEDADYEDSIDGGGIHIYDTSDLSSPSYIAPFYSQGTFTVSLAQADDSLFVSQTYGLGLVSLSLYSPAGAKEIPGAPLNAGLLNRCVIPVGDYFIASSDSGMDIVHKDSPYTVAADFPFDGFVSELGNNAGAYAVKGNYLFGFFRDRIEWDNDFLVYDMADPENPLLLFDDEDEFTQMERFALHGEYIYAKNNQYITALNIADPREPFIAGNTYLGTSIKCIVPVGNYLFAGSAVSPEIFLLDITNRAQGEVIDVIELPTGARIGGMSRSGNFIYCVNETPGIAVLDVSDPLNTKILDKAGIAEINDYIADLGHQYTNIRIEGDYAFCYSDSSLVDSFVDIIDISSTYQPSLVRSIDAQTIQSCTIDGNRLYIVEYDSGIRAFDLWEEME